MPLHYKTTGIHKTPVTDPQLSRATQEQLPRSGHVGRASAEIKNLLFKDSFEGG